MALDEGIDHHRHYQVSEPISPFGNPEASREQVDIHLP
jgi:hypothetical protein